MALTKAVAAVDEWAEVAQNAVREGAVVNTAGMYEAMLHILCCLSSTTAHTGSDIIVQVSSNTSGDEDWTTLTSFSSPVGTAVSQALPAEEPAAETTIAITNPATAGLDNNGKYKFIENTTVANSEVVFQTAQSGDAGDTITILDGLTNTQQTTSVIFDIDSPTLEAVGIYVVAIPMSASRARVIYDNTADPDGSTIHTNCRISSVTAV